MSKLKVMTVVGTRPEIIRLSRVICKIDIYCDHTLVHTGQNFDYELSQVFFEDLGIRKPDIFLNAASSNAAQTIGNIITQIDEVYEDYEPEAVLILGDTNSSLAAIPAKRRKIPVFHMEAGNRCFDQNVPEEINRKIVDHISDINLTYSAIARENLIREGLPSDRIIKVGSPMKEVLSYYMPKIKESSILKRLNLKQEEYYLISIHREENVDSEKSLRKILELLDQIAIHFNKPLVVSTHPRTQKRLESLGFKSNSLIKFMKPFGLTDYINLQLHAKCVLSDSGTITEESSILNFPALNLRETQERHEGFEEGSVIMVGLSKDRVFQALNILNDQSRDLERSLKIVSDYDVLNVSDKVLRIIQSYTDFINRNVWRRC